MIITLRVTCVRGPYLKEPCVRVLEMDEDSCLYDLHDAIQDAVDFERDHPFSFFLANVPGGNRQWLTEAEEWRDMEDDFCRILLREVFPTGRRRLYYLFDFGDYWTFEVRKARGSKPAEAAVTYPRLVESLGPDPVQYPAWDEK